jgi:lipoprotein-anchoring transpeptidase ErfK/SrfK
MQSLPRKIRVSIAAQRLELLESSGNGSERIVAGYPVSTSVFGIGSEPGSHRTPVGKFTIGEMIGAGAPVGMVFVSREPTGEIASSVSLYDPRDLVLTRILWLEGLEPHNANTRDRYIYIHGTNHEERIGEPSSHGCVRMRNADMVELFAQVEPGLPVTIEA